MRRQDLSAPLREEFTPEKEMGVMRTGEPGWENLWFVVPPAPPRALPPGLPARKVAMANTVLQSRPHWRDATPLDRLSAYLFLRQEALTSSRMEGTWSTIDDVLSPSEEDGPSNTASVRGYANALEYGYQEVQESGIDAFTSELICALHERVMSRDPRFRGIAGRPRQSGKPGAVVFIGGSGRREDSIFNPAPPEEVARCLDQVMAWHRDHEIVELGDAGAGMSLPVRMAIGHAHFEAVHPFPDGNGRVGRMLWPLQMMAAGYLPLFLSGYVEENRAAYGAALRDAQQQLTYTAMIEFLCDAIVGSDQEETVSKTCIANLPLEWAARLRARKGSAAVRALEVLQRAPITTTALLKETLGVTFASANLALRQLQDSGIVRERSGGRRNRVFAAEEVIAILSRPFGSDPEVALEGARQTLGLD